MSTGRAFVVQFRAETDVAASRFQGRVEHVASGRVEHFQSLDELLDFMVRALADVGLGSSERPDWEE
jgi:hypothetical protein